MHHLAGQRVLLASSIRWPVAAKLALAFLRHGCEVQAVCPADHPFAYVRGITKIYPYRGVDSLRSLYEAITATDPDLVVPCDDGVVWQLHELHRTKQELRPLIERSLGAATGYEAVASRGRFMKIVEELHVRAPRTRDIASADDLRDWFSEPGGSGDVKSGAMKAGVLKLDWTCGGTGVRVVRSLGEAERVLAEMRRPQTVGTAVGRWMLIHDALALWKWKNHREAVLTIQEFVAGRPANTMMACRDGRVLALVTVEVLYARGVTGTALAVRLVENDEIRTAAERIAERLQLSGFHGLDFILEDGTGHEYLIELNPRCTQLGHLDVGSEGDLAGVFCRAFTGAPRQENQRPICQKKIAFFPEALKSNPKCPFLERAYIDAPWEEPRLVHELMGRDWRDRKLLARIYRALRPPNGTAVAFEAVASVDSDVPTRGI